MTAAASDCRSTTVSAGSTAAAAALDYAAFAEIFEQYRHAEFLADWHDAVARYGVADAGMHLARTDAQRSWDAMMRIAPTPSPPLPAHKHPNPSSTSSAASTPSRTLLADAGLIPDPTTTDDTPPSDPCRVRIGVRPPPGSPSHRPTSCKP